MQLIWRLMRLGLILKIRVPHKRVKNLLNQTGFLFWLKVIVMQLFSLSISYVITIYAERISSNLQVKFHSTRKLDRVITKKATKFNFPFNTAHFAVNSNPHYKFMGQHFYYPIVCCTMYILIKFLEVLLRESI